MPETCWKQLKTKEQIDPQPPVCHVFVDILQYFLAIALDTDLEVWLSC